MIIYGRNVLRELLLSSQPLRMVYFSDQHDKELDELIEKVKERKLPFTIAPRNVLKKLCGEEKIKELL